MMLCMGVLTLLSIGPPTMLACVVSTLICGIQQLLALASSCLCSCSFVSGHHKNACLSVLDGNNDNLLLTSSIDVDAHEAC